MRLGIGHPGHKDRVAGYVLHDFAKADQAWLDDLLSGIGEGVVKLAGKDPAGFMNKVALKAQAQKPQKPKAAQPHKNEAALEKPQSPDKEDLVRTPLQRLIDKFK